MLGEANGKDPKLIQKSKMVHKRVSSQKEKG